jgi:tRNA nucleotidyltransferase (CCA-adding enzyme)
MGREASDVDYCFSGSESELMKLFPKAYQVGISFPVFMVNGCEVALTRTEESNGDSYGDFIVTNVGVSIEEDLNRRDFTMNQIAINTMTQEVIDPTGGKNDITGMIIRTTNTKAFEEDPVRILRAIRFATTMGFAIETETFQMMKENVHRLEFITKERIVLELEKMWKGANVPSVFFTILSEIGGLKFISPVFEAMENVPAGPFKYHGDDTVFDHTMNVINRIKQHNGTFSAFIAGLTHDFGKTVTPAHVLPGHHGHEFNGLELAKEFITNNRFDSYTNELILVAMRNHMLVRVFNEMRTITKVKFVKSIPKHMVEDFKVIVFSDHERSQETKNFISFVFATVNSFRMTKEDIERVKNTKDKKEVAIRIITKHLASKIKEIEE